MINGVEKGKTTSLLQMFTFGRTIDVEWEFIKGIRNGRCDIVDEILLTGYVPPRDSIRDACMIGNIDMVTRLLKYDMDVQLGMQTAIEYKRIDLLDHLYLAGANPNHIDGHGKSLWEYSFHLESYRWLHKMGVPTLMSGYCVKRVCRSGNAEMVKMIITPDDVNAESCGHTALYYSCYHGNIDTVKLLLSYRANQVAGRNGKTPLHKASRHGHAEVVKLLIESGGTQTTDNLGDTPLYLACKHSHVEVVRILLQYGATQQANNRRDTPLRACQRIGNSEIIHLLNGTTPPKKEHFWRNYTP